MPETAPYGSWKSPLTADRVAARTDAVEEIVTAGASVYWTEERASESGRSALVRWTDAEGARDVLDARFDVVTRCFEYGGGAYLIAGDAVIFANRADQRLWRAERNGSGDPRPITPEGPFRYADPVWDRARGRIVCIREDHSGKGEAVTTLVAVTLDGEAPVRVLVSGRDFYFSPRIDSAGKTLSWIEWDHPHMPWDQTRLCVAELDGEGIPRAPKTIAGGPGVSVCSPRFSPDGSLVFASDQTGFWNLHSWRAPPLSGVGASLPLAPMEAEFAFAPWESNRSVFDFLPDGRIVCAFQRPGAGWALAILERSGLREIPTPWTRIHELKVGAGKAYVRAGSPLEPWSVGEVDLATGATRVLKRQSELGMDASRVSVPRAIEFPTENGKTAHGFFYPPANPGFAAPAGERPPLLVLSHGGPTSETTDVYKPEIQYFTSRGFAVVDVNYGGSTGYGRAYRERLRGRWGEVDVDDCVNAAVWLAARGDADAARLAIRGGSAGGYTTLSALTFRDAFKAGASYFGVGDLEALARDTHKFESRYLDGLIGPLPERADLYRARSPIHATDRLSAPAIFFQGLDDKVVPPDQAQRMVAALRARGLPVAYLSFPGEAHGFRRAETKQRCLEAELSFYARVFGFTPADELPPLEIENLK